MVYEKPIVLTILGRHLSGGLRDPPFQQLAPAQEEVINLDLHVNALLLLLLLLLLLYYFFLYKHSVFIVTLLLEMFWLEAAWWQKLLISECRVTYPEMDTTLRPRR